MSTEPSIIPRTIFSFRFRIYVSKRTFLVTTFTYTKLKTKEYGIDTTSSCSSTEETGKFEKIKHKIKSWWQDKLIVSL